MTKVIMNIKQILNLSSRDISNLSDQDLRKIIITADSAANKRIKRAYKEGVSSEIIDRTLENGKFSVKGIEARQGLENALVGVTQFLKAKTSTIRGIRSEQNKMFKNLAKEVNKDLEASERINATDWQKDLDDTEIKRITDMVWTQIDKMSEDKKLAITKKERYRLAARAFDVVTRKSRPVRTKRGLLKNLRFWYEKEYEKSNEDMSLQNMTSEEREIEAAYNNFT